MSYLTPPLCYVTKPREVNSLSASSPCRLSAPPEGVWYAFMGRIVDRFSLGGPAGSDRDLPMARRSPVKPSELFQDIIELSIGDLIGCGGWLAAVGLRRGAALCAPVGALIHVPGSGPEGI